MVCRSCTVWTGSKILFNSKVTSYFVIHRLITELVCKLSEFCLQGILRKLKIKLIA